MLDKVAFAKRLRELREEKGWTQKEAAEKCGIVCSTYSAYENKKNTKSPLLDVAVQIAEGYGITLNELCGMEVKPPEEPKAVEPPAEDRVYTCAEVARLLMELEKQNNIQICVSEANKYIESATTKAGMHISDLSFPVDVIIHNKMLSRFFLIRNNLKESLSRSNPYNSFEVEMMNQETYETWENAQIKQLESIYLKGDSEDNPF